MERRSSILRRIGKFKITIDELEDLAAEVEAESAQRPLTLYKIGIKTKNSTYTYQDVEDLRRDKAWNKAIETFEINFWERGDDEKLKDRTISIVGGEAQDNHIYVSGDDEAWVVGTMDVLTKKMKRYEVWYSRLTKGSLLQLLYCFAICISLLSVSTYIIRKFVNDHSSVQVLHFLSLFLTIAVSLWLTFKISIRSMLLKDRIAGAKTNNIAMVVLYFIIAITGVVSLLLQLW